ncbi:MAG TPA: acetylornithine deacetylase, partial [Thermoanaerobaculia bacterium]
MDAARAVELYGRLVAADTTSARSNLAAIAILEEALDRRAGAVRRFPSPDGAKASLFARLGPEVDPETR